MPEMKIKPKFDLGQTVYLKTDPEQYERMVVGINVRSGGLYYVIRHAGEETTEHSVLELDEKIREFEKEDDLNI